MEGAVEGAEVARVREGLFFGAREAFDGELEAEGFAVRRAAAHRDGGKRAAATCVTCTFPGVVGGDSLCDVARDAAIERAITAAGEVDEPIARHGSS
jgi:hypothetical protein